MDEVVVQGTEEVTADLNDVDVSDIDFGIEEEAFEEPTPDTEEADHAEAEEGEAEAEETEPDDSSETDQFTLKHLGEEKTVSRDEVVTLAQKGMDYDRIRQKLDEATATNSTLNEEKAKTDETMSFLRDLAKQQGFSDVNAFINETRAAVLADGEGIDISVARKRLEIERKEKELAEKEAKLTATTTEKDSAEAEARKQQEKQQADFLEFASEYTDIKPEQIPTDVWKIYGKGDCTLVQAYIRYENQQLKAKLAAAEKNAENKQRSTGSMRSAGNNNTNSDPWLADLESRL